MSAAIFPRRSANNVFEGRNTNQGPSFLKGEHKQQQLGNLPWENSFHQQRSFQERTLRKIEDGRSPPRLYNVRPDSLMKRMKSANEASDGKHSVIAALDQRSNNHERAAFDIKGEESTIFSSSEFPGYLQEEQALFLEDAGHTMSAIWFIQIVAGVVILAVICIVILLDAFFYLKKRRKKKINSPQHDDNQDVIVSSDKFDTNSDITPTPSCTSIHDTLLAAENPDIESVQKKQFNKGPQTEVKVYHFIETRDQNFGKANDLSLPYGYDLFSSVQSGDYMAPVPEKKFHAEDVEIGKTAAQYEYLKENKMFAWDQDSIVSIPYEPLSLVNQEGVSSFSLQNTSESLINVDEQSRQSNEIFSVEESQSSDYSKNETNTGKASEYLGISSLLPRDTSDALINLDEQRHQNNQIFPAKANQSSPCLKYKSSTHEISEYFGAVPLKHSRGKLNLFNDNNSSNSEIFHPRSTIPHEEPVLQKFSNSTVGRSLPLDSLVAEVMHLRLPVERNARRSYHLPSKKQRR